MIAISPSYKIKDSSFDVNLIAKYDLYLQLHLNHLNICVFDTEGNQCLLFESYSFEGVDSTASVLDCLKGIWENNNLLTAGHWHKVICINVNRDFVFIPYEHYNEEAAINYLMLNCQFDKETHTLHHIKHYELDAVCYFPVNHVLEEWVNDQYKNIAVQHAHFNSCFLHGLLANDQETLAISIHPELLSIVLLENKKIKFINSFPYNTANDILYFILFVLDELKLSAEDAKLMLWSQEDDIEEIVSLLQKYVRNVELGGRPSNLSFPEDFDLLPEHHAFDLFSAYYLLR
ncbi:MAG: DUF3822 family protein [Flammeovirgaceae bacterium]